MTIMQPRTKSILYTALIAVCLLFGAFIFVNGRTKVEFPGLMERTGPLAKELEWDKTRQRVDQLMTKLEKNPQDTKSMLLLAKEYMQEARVTGNFSYYNTASLDLADKVLALDPTNLDAVCYKAMALLSQHRFAEGRRVAMDGLKMNPYNSFIYGLLVDANVEMGDYDEAVRMSDKMNQVRPDLRSYSRVSYLREIFGDPNGAIEAVNMAVEAGYPGREDTEWARMVLGHLYEDTNRPDLALEQYNISLSHYPNYPFALAGIGRIMRYNKDYSKAIEYFESARDIVSDGSFFAELTDLYRLNGQPEKAEECARATLNAMLADNAAANRNQNEGHYADYELANLYLKLGEPDKAYEHARKEYDRRPQNIDANETLAWVLYKQGKADEAERYAREALRTRSQKPERLVKMGLILSVAGHRTDGDPLIDKGMELKPYMDEELVETVNDYRERTQS